MTTCAMPRRILMTLDAAGGVGRYAIDLAKSLRLEGIDTVFAGFGPLPSRAMQAEATAVGTLHWSEAPLDWMAKDPAEVAGIPAQLAALASAMSVDLLHLNMPSQAAGLVTDLPVVVVSHSCVSTWFAAVRGELPPLEWQWQGDLNRRGFEGADAIIAPSRSHADALSRTYGITGIDVVHNASRHVPSRLKKLTYCFAAGRWWDEGKNAAVLDRTAALTACPIVAAGPVEGVHGERARFEFVDHCGALDHAEAMTLLDDAAIFISPSKYEPFGLAALEAGRAGAALVLADIPTYRELWQDVALFADPDDAAGFAAAIARLAESRHLCQRMALAAQERSQQFTMDSQMRAVRAVYARAMERRSQPAAAE